MRLFQKRLFRNGYFEFYFETTISKRLLRILFRNDNFEKNFTVISNLILKTVISKKWLGTWSISVLYGDRIWREGDRIWREDDRIWHEGDRKWREDDRIWREGDRIWREGDSIWREGDSICISWKGSSLSDWRHTL